MEGLTISLTAALALVHYSPIEGFSLGHLILQLLKTPLYPASVAGHLGVQAGVRAAPQNGGSV